MASHTIYITNGSKRIHVGTPKPRNNEPPRPSWWAWALASKHLGATKMFVESGRRDGGQDGGNSGTPLSSLAFACYSAWAVTTCRHVHNSLLISSLVCTKHLLHEERLRFLFLIGCLLRVRGWWSKEIAFGTTRWCSDCTTKKFLAITRLASFMKWSFMTKSKPPIPLEIDD